MIYVWLVVAFIVGLACGYRWGMADATRVWSRFAYHRWVQTQSYVDKIENQMKLIKQRVADAGVSV